MAFIGAGTGSLGAVFRRIRKRAGGTDQAIRGTSGCASFPGIAAERQVVSSAIGYATVRGAAF